MKPLLTPPPPGARELVGGGNYGDTMRLYVDGDDLVARGVVMTWFGGDDDPQDSGHTASGVMTKGHPECLGCALPKRYPRWTAGSPIPPGVPWGTMVRIWSHETLQTIEVPLIDLGPNHETAPGHAIDVTKAGIAKLLLSPVPGEYLVDFRILGGARYIVESS